MSNSKIHIKNTLVPLTGKVVVNGSKNATLPIMAAALLTDEQVIIRNTPNILDVIAMSNLLENFGAEVNMRSNFAHSSRHVLEIKCEKTKNLVATNDMTKGIRASCLALGPLLTRFKKAKISLPGGCLIGARPIDIHIDALEKMGAQINVYGGYIEANAPDGLFGKSISFNKVSVGATCNIMMAATLANGRTIIQNAAVEPEVNDLANALIKMGANIIGIGTKTLTIYGVKTLSGVDYSVIPDRMEACTYALAAILTNGEIEIIGVKKLHIDCTIEYLKRIGAKIIETNQSIIVSRDTKVINSTNIITNPYPSFPSDMQPQFAAAMCLAKGISTIEENVFEDRFKYISQLKKLGADIHHKGKKAIIKGVDKLKSNYVLANDIRATAALLLAGLVAEGRETVIEGACHLNRGYEAMDEKLNQCGADIKINSL